MSIVIARVADPASFGAFSLGLSVYLFALAISRSLCADPYIVRFSALNEKKVGRVAQDALGAAFLLGIPAGGVLIGVGGLGGWPPAMVIVVLGIAMPILLLQDCERYVLFGARKERAAAANDALWCAVEGLLLMILFLGHAKSPGALVAVFGVGAGVAMCTGWRQIGVLPAPGRGWRWLREQRDLGLPFASEVVVVSGAMQVTIVCVAAVAGLVAVGELRAATLLFGPLTVLFLGAMGVLLPEAVRLAQTSYRSFLRLVAAMGVVMPAIALTWTGVLVLTPARIGELVLGKNWAGGRHVVIPIGIVTAGNGCIIGCVVGLRALSAAKQSLRARLLGVPVMVAGGVLGVMAAGAYGAAWGIGLAVWVDAGLAWLVLARRVRGLRQDAGLRGAVVPTGPGAE